MKQKRVIFTACWMLAATLALAATPLSKATQKTYKAECKQLKKEGWKNLDTARPVEEALMPYYQLIDDGGSNVVHIVANGKSKSVNTARRKAMSNASAQLAAITGSSVAATTTTTMSNKQGAEAEASQDFDASVRSTSEATIKGLVPIVSLNRELPDGTTEVRLYYVVTLNEKR